MFAFDSKNSRSQGATPSKFLVMCGAAFLLASQVRAQPAGSAIETAPMPSSALSAATAQEVQRMSESMTIFQAQFNLLELKAKIAEKQRDLATLDGSDAVTSFGRKAGNPSVVGVAGLLGSLEAVLIFPGGVTQRVKAGDVIEGRRVQKIAVNEVVLADMKGKNPQRLAFGSASVTREEPRTTSMGAAPLHGGSSPMAATR